MSSLSAPRNRLSITGLALALFVAACAGGTTPSPSPSPAPTVKPSPTPIAAKVATAEDAATLVIATDPRFASITKLDPDIIGASRWWEATPLATGGYRIKITIGWGDCPAGCIDRHIWTYDVSADGQVKLVGEEGPEVPSDLPA